MKKKNLQILVGICLLFSLVSVFYTYSYGTSARLYDSKSIQTNLTLSKGSSAWSNMSITDWTYTGQDKDVLHPDDNSFVNIKAGYTFTKTVTLTYQGKNTGKYMITPTMPSNNTNWNGLLNVASYSCKVRVNDGSSTNVVNNSTSNSVSGTITNNQNLKVTFQITFNSSSNVSLAETDMPQLKMDIQNHLVKK